MPISVVLPVYNGERFLAEALDSILTQTFADFELIAVDDGSTDGSLAILRAYAERDKRVRIITRPNTGVVGARNDGLAATTGEFIAWMDSDDRSLPDRFLRQHDFLRTHAGIGAVSAAYQAMDEAGDYVGSPISNPCEPEKIRRALQRGRCALVQGVAMMRRDAVLRAGAYRRLFVSAEDYDLWLRMSEAVDLANLLDVLLLVRLHAASLSHKRPFKQALCTEVARRAGVVRRRRGNDPIQDEEEITPRLLERVGISPDDVELLRGHTLRHMASNQLDRGNLPSALAAIAEYEGAEIPPWVRRRLAPEFELLQARARKTQGHSTAVASGAVRICLRHPLFVYELAAKALRRLRR